LRLDPLPLLIAQPERFLRMTPIQQAIKEFEITDPKQQKRLIAQQELRQKIQS